MYSGVEAILKAFDENVRNGLAAWKLYSNNKGTVAPIAMSFINHASDSENKELLRDTLNRLLPGNYRIDFKKDHSDSKGYNQIPFEIVNERAPALAGLAPQAGGSEYVPKSEVRELIGKALADHAQKQELKALKEKVKELEEREPEPESAFAQIGKLLENPMVQMLAGILLGPKAAQAAQVGLAGFNSLPEKEKETEDTSTSSLTKNEEGEDDINARIDVVLDKLEVLEGSTDNAVLLLEKLLLWIEKNPALYATIKPQILNTK